MRRFYLPDLPVDADVGTAVRLEGPEVHHLLNVVRVRPGEGVELFDGRGVSVPAEMTGSSRRHVDLTLTGPPCRQPPMRPAVHLAIPFPKHDRLRWLIEKATELGVSAIIPLETERTVVKPGEGKLERLEEGVVQACKQCGRNELLTIESPMRWAEFLANWDGKSSTSSNSGRLLLAEPKGQRMGDVIASFGDSRPDPVVIAFGPEGGLTDQEVSAAVSAGAIPVSLGPWILRIETAALAAAAVVIASLDEPQGWHAQTEGMGVPDASRDDHSARDAAGSTRARPS